MTSKKIGTLMTAGILMSLGALSHAAFLDVTFGSDHDGYAGFTATSEYGTWTEQSDSIRNLQQNSPSTPTYSNAALMRELGGASALSTAAGSSYTFTSEISSTSTNTGGNDLNRFGMVMFANTDQAASIGSAGIAVVLTAESNLRIGGGINNFSAGVGALTAWTGQSITNGSFTLESAVSFTATDANIIFTLTDGTLHSQTLTHTIARTSLNLGDFHGFGTRTDTRNNNTFTMDVQSMQIIPEPSSLLLTGVALLGALVFRRRARA
ncbi:MAG: PEP-CTERM sorting domain-containing protein [Verrucomicrobia bacterium]|nr:PEP-CTERM sorting domain-containing protein [Verrucomicrobiota bacterium]MCH8526960.1 PEP-CTERM sorting domain-containing protein [Kiritimatiellia bacterium]